MSQSTMIMSEKTIRVLCVDDNFLVAEGIRIKLDMAGGFEWAGQLPDANNLVQEAKSRQPDVVLLDLDMPGKDAFAALRELATALPTVRTIIISGHVRGELIDKAVEAGAWGYISKGEGSDSIATAVTQVMKGQFYIGQDAVQEFRG